MTTTRINHTGHNHPNTTAARTACRKAMKSTPTISAGAIVQHRKVGQARLISPVGTAGWWTVQFITGPKAYVTGAPRRLFVTSRMLVG